MILGQLSLRMNQMFHFKIWFCKVVYGKSNFKKFVIAGFLCHFDRCLKQVIFGKKIIKIYTGEIGVFTCIGDKSSAKKST